jgi:2-hydroxychromene-2-carboxylate isomerase
MAETLDFYFDFTSPYGYIASQIIDDIADKYGCATRWHAFLVTAAYKQHNASNPLTHPAKQKYFRQDIPRTAAHFGVPFKFPATWPENLVAAGRAFSWIEDRDPEAAKRFAKAALRAYWVEGKALADADVVAEIGAAAGEGHAMLRAALDDSAVKQRFTEKGSATLAQGVFGSPQIVYRGELFWGTDRLDQLRATLEKAAAA